MSSINRRNKTILSVVDMNKNSKNIYAHTCPPAGSYNAIHAGEGVTGGVIPYRTLYDRHLNDKFCYQSKIFTPNRYQS